MLHHEINLIQKTSLAFV